MTEKDITRRSVLIECLRMYDHELEMVSADNLKLQPRKNCEVEFITLRKKTQILRELIQALESEPVRRSINTWQEEVMSGNRQTGLFAPEQTRLVFMRGRKEE